MKSFVELQKLKPGDKVAIVSPAGDAAGRFPWVYQVGLERLRKEFGLMPKEYPTTTKIGATHEEKAKDLMAAFADANNKAVISTLGGYDQVRLLKHLKADVFVNNPKPFFGYSDNTHVINFLWNLGIPAYYGGALMIQFGHSYANKALTAEYLNHALFDRGEFELKPSEEFSDEGVDWADENNWKTAGKIERTGSWVWDTDNDAEGILYGGCLESMIVKFAAGNNIPTIEEIESTVLFLETSEEMPEAWMVGHLLNGMGERGWFNKFEAVLFGRPKAWHFHRKLNSEQKVIYKKEQQEAVINSIRYYNKKIPIIQNMDFGHTDPQIVVPSGKKARIDSKNKKIFFTY